MYPVLKGLVEHVEARLGRVIPECSGGASDGNESGEVSALVAEFPTVFTDKLSCFKGHKASQPVTLPWTNGAWSGSEKVDGSTSALYLVPPAT